MELSANLLTHAPFLERARVEHERARDLSARLALGAYLVLRLVDRMLGRSDEPLLEEGVLWQLEAVRRHLQELPADTPESAHLHGITDAIQAGPRPFAGLRLSLMAYAYFLEHEARLEESLEVLALAVRTHGGAVPSADFAASALFAARLNRLLARWDAATWCYLSAGSAAEQAQDRVLMLRARLGRGAVHRGQGNLPLAREVAQEVADTAREAGLREVEAMAYADLGSVFSNEGRGLESVHALYRAFQLFEDGLQRTRTLGDLGTALRDIQAIEAARTAFDIVSRANTSFIVRANATLELMDMESASGDRLAFERRRGEAESLRSRMPPSMVCDYLFKLGIGLSRFGRPARARSSLEQGRQWAEEHQVNAWYFRFERSLAELHQRELREPDPAPTQVGFDPPAVDDIVFGLREFALQES